MNVRRDIAGHDDLVDEYVVQAVCEDAGGGKCVPE